MAEREELAGALLECLKEIASLMELAYETGMRQQDALTKSDAEMIAVTCTSQDDILRRIMQADERAAAVSEILSDQCGVDLNSADAETIASAVGPPYGILVARELGRIPKLALKLRDINEINSQLLANGLDVITSCLRIVTRESQPTVYSQSASLASQGNKVLSLDSRV